MANPRTQMRLQQLTGSAVDIKADTAPQAQATAAAFVGSDLQDYLAALGGAIERVHGAGDGEFFNNAVAVLQDDAGNARITYADGGGVIIGAEGDGATALTIGSAVSGDKDVTAAANLTVAGNLTVNGTTTTVNSTTVTIDDQFILLADGAQSANTPSGIVFASGSSVGARPDVAFARVANDTWALGTVASNSGSNTDSVPANFDVALRAFKVELGAATEHITADGTDVTIAGGSGDITLDAADDIILDAAGDRIDFKKNGTLMGALSMDTANVLKFLDNGQVEIFRIDGTNNDVAIPANTAVNGGGSGGLLSFATDGTEAAIYSNDDDLYLRSNNVALRLPDVAGNPNDVLITDGTNGNLSFADANTLISSTAVRTVLTASQRVLAGANGLILTSSDHTNGTQSHLFGLFDNSPYTGSLASDLNETEAANRDKSVQFYVNGQLLVSGAALQNNGVAANSGDYALVSVSATQISASFAFDLEADDVISIQIL